MTQLAVLTPSYRGDLALFDDLHRSVSRFTGPDVVHHVVVPPSDAARFQAYAGRRCRVWTHRDLLPRSYVPVRNAAGLAVSLRRPWLPVRGWIVQQLMKMAAASVIDADIVLIIDSDAVLVREVTPADLLVEGGIGHYRSDNAVTPEMERHVRWHHVARRLLGLPPPASGTPLPDYVSAMSVWDATVLRGLQNRIAAVTGKHWLDAVACELHVSEFVLYGVFADEILTGRKAFADPLCHDYYARIPLDADSAVDFARRMPPQVCGAMVSSHSHTSMAMRAEAFRRCREAASAPTRRD